MVVKVDDLACNYLRTSGGTCCAKCAVLGKHYLVDKQPLLYWFDKQWLCEKCIEGDGDAKETRTLCKESQGRGQGQESLGCLPSFAQEESKETS